MVTMTGALLLLTALGCIRPSDDYPVQIYGAGTALDEVLPDPEPMGDTIEYTRMRLWGSILGHGLSGLEMLGFRARGDAAPMQTQVLVDRVMVRGSMRKLRA